MIKYKNFIDYYTIIKNINRKYVICLNSKILKKIKKYELYSFFSHIPVRKMFKYLIYYYLLPNNVNHL